MTRLVAKPPASRVTHFVSYGAEKVVLTGSGISSPRVPVLLLVDAHRKHMTRVIGAVRM